MKVARFLVEDWPVLCQEVREQLVLEDRLRAGPELSSTVWQSWPSSSPAWCRVSPSHTGTSSQSLSTTGSRSQWSTWTNINTFNTFSTINMTNMTNMTDTFTATDQTGGMVLLFIPKLYFGWIMTLLTIKKKSYGNWFVHYHDIIWDSQSVSHTFGTESYSRTHTSNLGHLLNSTL